MNQISFLSSLTMPENGKVYKLHSLHDFMYIVYLLLPSISTCTMSLTIDIVVKKTRMEKRKVHSGSAIFHSGCNERSFVYIMYVIKLQYCGLVTYGKWSRQINPLYRNVRRDVTAWTGWQRSHHCHPLLTRQKRCFYKGQSLTWAHIFVVHSNIRNLLGYFKRGNISLPDDISLMKIYWQIKEKL